MRMPDYSRGILRRAIPLAILQSLIQLLGACGGGGGTWYYHWRCNGDPDCLALNPTGAPSGDRDEGNESSCRSLMNFSAHFWGDAAEDACDQSPSPPWAKGTGGATARDAGAGSGTGGRDAAPITDSAGDPPRDPVNEMNDTGADLRADGGADLSSDSTPDTVADSAPPADAGVDRRFDGDAASCGAPAITAGSWASALAAPHPAGGWAGGVIGGLFYLAGAEVQPAYASVFDPAAPGAWTALTAMSETDNAPAFAVLGGKLFLAGGAWQSDTMNNSDRLQIYDPAGNAWDSTRRAAPTARNRAAAGAIGGKLYVVGGMARCAPCTPLAALEVYDPATDTWDATQPALPTARTGPAAAVIDGKLYVVGGADFGVPASGPQHNIFFTTLEVYDPVARAWDTTRAPMPTGRREPAAAVLDGRLYVMGGITAGGATAAVEVYDPCTNTWTTVASLPAPRSSAVAGVIGRAIHLVGGRATDYNTTLTTHEVFNP